VLRASVTPYMYRPDDYSTSGFQARVPLDDSAQMEEELERKKSTLLQDNTICRCRPEEGRVLAMGEMSTGSADEQQRCELMRY